jgi:hypothetical protein
MMGEEWTGNVTRIGELRDAYLILVGKPERRSLEKPRRVWENNIKINVTEIGFQCMDRIVLAQNRDRWRALAGTATRLRVTLTCEYFL